MIVPVAAVIFQDVDFDPKIQPPAALSSDRWSSNAVLRGWLFRVSEFREKFFLGLGNAIRQLQECNF
jgi:hypothetical protein